MDITVSLNTDKASIDALTRARLKRPLVTYAVVAVASVVLIAQPWSDSGDVASAAVLGVLVLLLPVRIIRTARVQSSNLIGLPYTYHLTDDGIAETTSLFTSYRVWGIIADVRETPELWTLRSRLGQKNTLQRSAFSPEDDAQFRAFLRERGLLRTRRSAPQRAMIPR